MAQDFQGLTMKKLITLLVALAVVSPFGSAYAKQTSHNTKHATHAKHGKQTTGHKKPGKKSHHKHARKSHHQA